MFKQNIKNSYSKTVDGEIFYELSDYYDDELKNLNNYDTNVLRPNIIKSIFEVEQDNDMLKLNKESKIMFTDSGGLQEECTVIGTPCLTLRENTERPITLYENGGVSILVGNQVKSIKDGYDKIISIKLTPKHPKYWDGNTAERCLHAILNYK